MTALASVIVNNYNYGRFLAEAVDSALSQTYPRTEVIVVDDGSRDDSREVIDGYGDRVTAICKQNGGQASALNAGYLAARGDIVLFLDADDVLFPTAVAESVSRLGGNDLVKVHWPLVEMDEGGAPSGQLRPREALPEGDLRAEVIAHGPDCYLTPPTTGNAWSRGFLERVMPIPEVEFRLCADAFLFGLAPLFGPIGRITEPQGLYRLHGTSNYSAVSFEEKLDRDLVLYRHRCEALSRHGRAFGLRMDPRDWERRSWLRRLQVAVRELSEVIPSDSRYILVDDEEWGMAASTRQRPIPFLERDGRYWGRPTDDETAIHELERLRDAGAAFLAFGWPAFWWLEHYKGFHAFLRSSFPPVLDNERLLVFDVRDPAGASAERRTSCA